MKFFAIFVFSLISFAAAASISGSNGVGNGSEEVGNEAADDGGILDGDVLGDLLDGDLLGGIANGELAHLGDLLGGDLLDGNVGNI